MMILEDALDRTERATRMVVFQRREIGKGGLPHLRMRQGGRQASEKYKLFHPYERKTSLSKIDGQDNIL